MSEVAETVEKEVLHPVGSHFSEIRLTELVILKRKVNHHKLEVRSAYRDVAAQYLEESVELQGALAEIEHTPRVSLQRH